MRSKTGCNRDPRGTPLVIGCNEELLQPNWMKIHPYSPSINVALVRLLTLLNLLVEFIGPQLCSERFFPASQGTPVYPPHQETQAIC